VPIYDYVCESCGRVIEVIHGLHADGPAECPDCGGAMSKVFAAPTIHFKGSGWAKKDRRSTSGSVKAKGTKQGEASGAQGSGPTAGSAPSSDSGGASGDRGGASGDGGGASGDRGATSDGSGGASGDSGRASGDSGGASGDSGRTSRADRADKE
jgi:putative FmdB family regulatory protein